jgi:transposase
LGLGLEDETWWSRWLNPTCTLGPLLINLRLVELERQRYPDRKALACYGLLVRWIWLNLTPGQMWLRFVDGRPVSAITTQFLDWCCTKVAALGKRVLALIWDNATWHLSQAVRSWIREHNRQVKATGQGVRILVCPLPIKSPWLNPIEPKWLHGKRRVVEPERTLSAQELAQRVCTTFDCAYEQHLSIPEKVS